MSSRPAVRAQPPLQRNASAGLQRPPAPQGRPPAYSQDAPGSRQAGAVIDLTTENEVRQSVQAGGWSHQSAGESGAPLNLAGKFAARSSTLPNLVLNSGSAIDTETLMAVDGRQSAATSPKPTAPSLPLPPRPLPRVPERSLPSGDVKQKPERKPEKPGAGYALEKPENAARYPDGRKF